MPTWRAQEKRELIKGLPGSLRRSRAFALARLGDKRDKCGRAVDGRKRGLALVGGGDAREGPCDP